MIQIILSKFLSIIYIYCTVNYNKTLHPTPHSNPFLFTKVHVIKTHNYSLLTCAYRITLRTESHVALNTVVL